MDVGSILLLLALVILVAAFIASPLRNEGKKTDQREINIELSELLAERERVLDALAELDFDNEMGKVPDELYPVQREALLKRGAAILRLLDEYMPEEIETAEAAPEISTEFDPDDPVEALIAAKRKARLGNIAKKDTKNNYCANCGAKLQPGDQFCPGCGHKL
jgi:hypothetical protein